MLGLKARLWRELTGRPASPFKVSENAPLKADALVEVALFHNKLFGKGKKGTLIIEGKKGTLIIDGDPLLR